jgi:Carboxypeptidase regulatory-like domain/TonB dependent receptor
MVRHRLFLWAALLCSVFAFVTLPALAQYTANVQGLVQDTSGAAVAKAQVKLQNTGTGETATTITDSGGNYRFVSLAPGSYQLTVGATGFASAQAALTLLTGQNLNIPLTLKVGSATESIIVTTEAPIIDTGDSRTELTLQNTAVAELPVVGRNLVTLVTMAPGVSGLGTSASGSPASGVDNFSTEEQVDVSANGQGQNNNQYIIDGLDVTSGIRQGVLNITPQPDTIQETSIQVNTFSVEHSRAAGIQVLFTTKSGTDTFHGSASNWFNYQGFFANQHFVSSDQSPYQPFHSNNMFYSLGGPIVPHHNSFFFFSVELLRSSASSGGSVTYAAPEFINFANTNYPSTVGTQVMSKYLPTGLGAVTGQQTAQNIFGSAAGGCGTAEGQNGVPCDLPMIDTASFGTTSIRNGTQYFGRVDQTFKKERIYGSIYRTLLEDGVPSSMPDFSALNHTWQFGIQGTWAHTFSPNSLNEATFGYNRVEGVLGSGAKDYTVPSISVNGINADGGQAYGVGFAQGDFIQHNYHWRDVLTHVRGTHTLKFGYEGWYGDDVEPFQGPWSQPKFVFNDLLKLAQDAPTNENGVMYNPETGKQQLWNWDAASRTFGLFAEDNWKASKNLTLTLGLRYDDSGNPWSKSAATVFGNFYFGTGTTTNEQIANGYAKQTPKALLHSVDNLWSPRVGAAWDITGKGDWLVRAGYGLFNNWLTSANVQEEFRGSPPGLVMPVFFPGTSSPPIFGLGTTNTPPFGFTFPTFPGGLNSQGGVVGASFAIGGIDPLLKSPKVNIWSASLVHQIGRKFAATVGYSGSHSWNIVGNGNSIGNVAYGVNINVLPGDLITHESLVPTRLNPSFGSIAYAQNDRYGNYNGIYVDLRGRFSRGFIDTSYTHSSSKDDGLAYPTPFNQSQYYAPSIFDVPNRFSLTMNYSLKGLNDGKGVVGLLTGGWGLSGTMIYQTGYPLTAGNGNSYVPVCANTSPGAPACPSFANPAVGYAPGSGDYNADGNDLDYPDALSYHQSSDNKAWLTGAIPKSNFAVPTFGNEGNEKPMQFRGPNFYETNANFYKDTPITERVNFQIRFEFFNLFNRANYTNPDTNFPDGNFGFATASHEPRFWQVAGRLSF